ncbi:MAG: hypothetical protein B6244_14895 [Candidatus Cloacimonetes bacterium 4572_55]|nr:MAG: hypothetical protein B6244_14895 [Candidatus Cloacimonetes bacterium 4572_55]
MKMVSPVKGQEFKFGLIIKVTIQISPIVTAKHLLAMDLVRGQSIVMGNGSKVKIVPFQGMSQ